MYYILVHNLDDNVNNTLMWKILDFLFDILPSGLNLFMVTSDEVEF